MFINKDNFWHKTDKVTVAKITVCEVHAFSASPNIKLF